MFKEHHRLGVAEGFTLPVHSLNYGDWPFVPRLDPTVTPHRQELRPQHIHHMPMPTYLTHHVDWGKVREKIMEDTAKACGIPFGKIENVGSKLFDHHVDALRYFHDTAEALGRIQWGSGRAMGKTFTMEKLREAVRALRKPVKRQFFTQTSVPGDFFGCKIHLIETIFLEDTVINDTNDRNNLTFIGALHHMQQGRQATRPSFVHGFSIGITGGKVTIYRNGKPYDTTNGALSVADMNATDWRVLPNEEDKKQDAIRVAVVTAIGAHGDEAKRDRFTKRLSELGYHVVKKEPVDAAKA